ncbi:aldehyde dehydrogenase [Sinobacterium caligoides]|uniref:Aldehyde dehydrogenase n=1 Tax=Sinobacterium caligoides TaxID=933926 RepID=A0A3N2DZT8_9GAMM|nr:aldehyde dehydrogenase [Sinobacterium caligoides]
MSFTPPEFQSQYDNYIDGQWVASENAQYFDNASPVDGKVFTRVARSQQADIDLALDAAHRAKSLWAQVAAAERSNLLLKIASVMEENLQRLAEVETWDNGKPIRETLAADLPLAIDHFRYFAGVIRAESGESSDLDATTVSMEVHEPLGVVGQIIPWNFPLLMAAWKLAPALAAGNCVVLKPAEQTPASIMVLMELIDGILPAGVLNVVNGFGEEAGEALASSTRINKIAFTGETSTGQKIMAHAAKNLIPVTLELGGKSPNIFFKSVMDLDDGFFDKAIEGFVMFALNQGEVCTCPSRALVHEDIYEAFIARVLERVAAINKGHPLDPSTMLGAQASQEQFSKINRYLDIGRAEGAKVLIGGDARQVDGLGEGYYIEPTVLQGSNEMRVFREEIFGPVVGVTTFKEDAEAIAIANDTPYGLGAGIWSRDMHQCHNAARAIQAGRVWVNSYHLYPAHASFGGYKKSGIGKETHKNALDNYRHSKNILVSYSKEPLGFF